MPRSRGEIGGGGRQALGGGVRVGVGDREWVQLGARRRLPRYRGKTGAQDHCSSIAFSLFSTWIVVVLHSSVNRQGERIGELNRFCVLKLYVTLRAEL